MSKEDFMANPDADYFRNLDVGHGLRPALIADAASDFSKIIDEVVTRVDASYQKIGLDHDDFRGDAGDQHREDMLSVKNYVNQCHEPIQNYGKGVHDFEQATTEAQNTIMNNMQCTPDSNPAEQTRIPARALQKLFYNVGTPVASDLTYPGKESYGPSTSDRGATPSGPTTASTAGGGSSGGGPVHASRGVSASDFASGPTPKTDSVDGAAEQGASDGKAPGSGASSPSTGGGAPSGAGSPSTGAGGAPTGGKPASGSPFDPDEAHTSAMSASDYTPASSLGGAAGYGGGVGTLGDHERALSSKPGSAAMRPGFQSVNVNTSGATGTPGMGGMAGGMAPGGVGKQADKERKTPDYLKSDEHSLAMLGGALPTVSPEVIGELTESEVVKIAEEAKEQDGQPKQQTTSNPPLPDASGGPQPRRKSDEQ